MELPMYFLSNPMFLIIIIALFLFETILKGFALWRAARNNQKGWFIMLIILNTAGILPLFYLFGITKRESQA